MSRARARKLSRRRAHGRSEAGSPGRKRTERLRSMGARPIPAGAVPPSAPKAHMDEESQSLWKGILSRPVREGLRIAAFRRGRRAAA